MHDHEPHNAPTMDSRLISAAQAAEQLACSSVVSAFMNSTHHNFLALNASQKGPATPATPLLFEGPASIKSINSVGSAGSCMSTSSGAASNETDPMSPRMALSHTGYVPVPVTRLTASGNVSAALRSHRKSQLNIPTQPSLHPLTTRWPRTRDYSSRPPPPPTHSHERSLKFRSARFAGRTPPESILG